MGSYNSTVYLDLRLSKGSADAVLASLGKQAEELGDKIDALKAKWANMTPQQIQDSGRQKEYDQDMKEIKRMLDDQRRLARAMQQDIKGLDLISKALEKNMKLTAQQSDQALREVRKRIKALGDDMSDEAQRELNMWKHIETELQNKSKSISAGFVSVFDEARKVIKTYRESSHEEMNKMAEDTEKHEQRVRDAAAKTMQAKKEASEADRKLNEATEKRQANAEKQQHAEQVIKEKKAQGVKLEKGDTVESLKQQVAQARKEKEETERQMKAIAKNRGVEQKVADAKQWQENMNREQRNKKSLEQAGAQPGVRVLPGGPAAQNAETPAEHQAANDRQVMSEQDKIKAEWQKLNEQEANWIKEKQKKQLSAIQQDYATATARRDVLQGKLPAGYKEQYEKARDDKAKADRLIMAIAETRGAEYIDENGKKVKGRGVAVDAALRGVRSELQKYDTSKVEGEARVEMERKQAENAAEIARLRDLQKRLASGSGTEGEYSELGRLDRDFENARNAMLERAGELESLKALKESGSGNAALEDRINGVTKEMEDRQKAIEDLTKKIAAAGATGEELANGTNPELDILQKASQAVFIRSKNPNATDKKKKEDKALLEKIRARIGQIQSGDLSGEMIDLKATDFLAGGDKMVKRLADIKQGRSNYAEQIRELQGKQAEQNAELVKLKAGEIVVADYEGMTPEELDAKIAEAKAASDKAKSDFETIKKQRAAKGNKAGQDSIEARIRGLQAQNEVYDRRLSDEGRELTADEKEKKRKLEERQARLEEDQRLLQAEGIDTSKMVSNEDNERIRKRSKDAKELMEKNSLTKSEQHELDTILGQIADLEWALAHEGIQVQASRRARIEQTLKDFRDKKDKFLADHNLTEEQMLAMMGMAPESPAAQAASGSSAPGAGAASGGTAPAAAGTQYEYKTVKPETKTEKRRVKVGTRKVAAAGGGTGSNALIEAYKGYEQQMTDLNKKIEDNLAAQEEAMFADPDSLTALTEEQDKLGEQSQDIIAKMNEALAGLEAIGVKFSDDASKRYKVISDIAGVASGSAKEIEEDVFEEKDVLMYKDADGKWKEAKNGVVPDIKVKVPKAQAPAVPVAPAPQAPQVEAPKAEAPAAPKAEEPKQTFSKAEKELQALRVQMLKGTQALANDANEQVKWQQLWIDALNHDESLKSRTAELEQQLTEQTQKFNEEQTKVVVSLSTKGLSSKQKKAAEDGIKALETLGHANEGLTKEYADSLQTQSTELAKQIKEETDENKKKQLRDQKKVIDDAKRAINAAIANSLSDAGKTYEWHMYILNKALGKELEGKSEEDKAKRIADDKKKVEAAKTRLANMQSITEEINASLVDGIASQETISAAEKMLNDMKSGKANKPADAPVAPTQPKQEAPAAPAAPEVKFEKKGKGWAEGEGNLVTDMVYEGQMASPEVFFTAPNGKKGSIDWDADHNRWQIWVPDENNPEKLSRWGNERKDGQVYFPEPEEVEKVLSAVLPKALREYYESGKAASDNRDDVRDNTHKVTDWIKENYGVEWNQAKVYDTDGNEVVYDPSVGTYVPARNQAPAQPQQPAPIQANQPSGSSANSPASTAIIAEESLQRMAQYIVDSPDKETGGALYGHYNEQGVPVVDWVAPPSANVAEDPTKEMAYDKDYLQRMGAVAQAFGLQSLGNWHSHYQKGNPVMSEMDMNAATTDAGRLSSGQWLSAVGAFRGSDATIGAFNSNTDAEHKEVEWTLNQAADVIQGKIDEALEKGGHLDRSKLPSAGLGNTKIASHTQQSASTASVSHLESVLKSVEGTRDKGSIDEQVKWQELHVKALQHSKELDKSEEEYTQEQTELLDQYNAKRSAVIVSMSSEGLKGKVKDKMDAAIETMKEFGFGTENIGAGVAQQMQDAVNSLRKQQKDATDETEKKNLKDKADRIAAAKTLLNSKIDEQLTPSDKLLKTRAGWIAELIANSKTEQTDKDREKLEDAQSKLEELRGLVADVNAITLGGIANDEMIAAAKKMVDDAKAERAKQTEKPAAPKKEEKKEEEAPAAEAPAAPAAPVPSDSSEGKKEEKPAEKKKRGPKPKDDRPVEQKIIDDVNKGFELDAMKYVAEGEEMTEQSAVALSNSATATREQMLDLQGYTERLGKAIDATKKALEIAENNIEMKKDADRRIAEAAANPSEASKNLTAAKERLDAAKDEAETSGANRFKAIMQSTFGGATSVYEYSKGEELAGVSRELRRIETVSKPAAAQLEQNREALGAVKEVKQRIDSATQPYVGVLQSLDSGIGRLQDRILTEFVALRKYEQKDQEVQRLQEKIDANESNARLEDKKKRLAKLKKDTPEYNKLVSEIEEIENAPHEAIHQTFNSIIEQMRRQRDTFEKGTEQYNAVQREIEEFAKGGKNAQTMQLSLREMLERKKAERNAIMSEQDAKVQKFNRDRIQAMYNGMVAERVVRTDEMNASVTRDVFMPQGADLNAFAKENGLDTDEKIRLGLQTAKDNYESFKSYYNQLLEEQIDVEGKSDEEIVQIVKNRMELIAAAKEQVDAARDNVEKKFSELHKWNADMLSLWRSEKGDTGMQISDEVAKRAGLDVIATNLANGSMKVAHSGYEQNKQGQPLSTTVTEFLNAKESAIVEDITEGENYSSEKEQELKEREQKLKEEEIARREQIEQQSVEYYEEENKRLQEILDKVKNNPLLAGSSKQHDLEWVLSLNREQRAEFRAKLQAETDAQSDFTDALEDAVLASRGTTNSLMESIKRQREDNKQYDAIKKLQDSILGEEAASAARAGIAEAQSNWVGTNTKIANDFYYYGGQKSTIKRRYSAASGEEMRSNGSVTIDNAPVRYAEEYIHDNAADKGSQIRAFVDRIKSGVTSDKMPAWAKQMTAEMSDNDKRTLIEALDTMTEKAVQYVQSLRTNADFNFEAQQAAAFEALNKEQDRVEAAKAANPKGNYRVRKQFQDAVTDEAIVAKVNHNLEKHLANLSKDPKKFMEAFGFTEEFVKQLLESGMTTNNILQLKTAMADIISQPAATLVGEGIQGSGMPRQGKAFRVGADGKREQLPVDATETQGQVKLLPAEVLDEQKLDVFLQNLARGIIIEGNNVHGSQQGLSVGYDSETSATKNPYVIDAWNQFLRENGFVDYTRDRQHKPGDRTYMGQDYEGDKKTEEEWKQEAIARQQKFNDELFGYFTIFDKETKKEIGRFSRVWGDTGMSDYENWSQDRKDALNKQLRGTGYSIDKIGLRTTSAGKATDEQRHEFYRLSAERKAKQQVSKEDDNWYMHSADKMENLEDRRDRIEAHMNHLLELQKQLVSMPFENPKNSEEAQANMEHLLNTFLRYKEEREAMNALRMARAEDPTQTSAHKKAETRIKNAESIKSDVDLIMEEDKTIKSDSSGQTKHTKAYLDALGRVNAASGQWKDYLTLRKEMEEDAKDIQKFEEENKNLTSRNAQSVQRQAIPLFDYLRSLTTYETGETTKDGENKLKKGLIDQRIGSIKDHKDTTGVGKTNVQFGYSAFNAAIASMNTKIMQALNSAELEGNDELKDQLVKKLIDFKTTFQQKVEAIIGDSKGQGGMKDDRKLDAALKGLVSEMLTFETGITEEVKLNTKTISTARYAEAKERKRTNEARIQSMESKLTEDKTMVSLNRQKAQENVQTMVAQGGKTVGLASDEQMGAVLREIFDKLMGQIDHIDGMDPEFKKRFEEAVTGYLESIAASDTADAVGAKGQIGNTAANEQKAGAKVDELIRSRREQVMANNPTEGTIKLATEIDDKQKQMLATEKEIQRLKDEGERKNHQEILDLEDKKKLQEQELADLEAKLELAQAHKEGRDAKVNKGELEQKEQAAAEDAASKNETLQETAAAEQDARDEQDEFYRELGDRRVYRADRLKEMYQQMMAEIDSASLTPEEHKAMAQEIATIKQIYNELIGNIAADLERIGSIEGPILEQMRKHFQEVINDVDAAQESIEAARKALASIAERDSQIATGGNRFSNDEVKDAIRNLQEYIKTAKLTDEERKKFVADIAQGNLYLEEMSKKDTITQMNEQFKGLRPEATDAYRALEDGAKKAQAAMDEATDSAAKLTDEVAKLEEQQSSDNGANADASAQVKAARERQQAIKEEMERLQKENEAHSNVINDVNDGYGLQKALDISSSNMSNEDRQKSIEENTKKLDDLALEYGKLNDVIEDNEAIVRGTDYNNEKQTAEIAEKKSKLAELSKEYEDNSKVVEENNKKMAKLQAEYEKKEHTNIINMSKDALQKQLDFYKEEIRLQKELSDAHEEEQAKLHEAAEGTMDYAERVKLLNTELLHRNDMYTAEEALDAAKNVGRAKFDAVKMRPSWRRGLFDKWTDSTSKEQKELQNRQTKLNKQKSQAEADGDLDAVDRINEQIDEVEKKLATLKQNKTGVLVEPLRVSLKELLKIKKSLMEARKQFAEPVDDEGRKKLLELDHAIKDIDFDIKAAGTDMHNIPDIINNLQSTPLDDLKQAAQQLKEQLDGMAENEDGRLEMVESYKEINAQISEMNEQLQEHKSQWEQAVSRLKTYVMVYMSFNKAMDLMKQVFNNTMQLSDQMTNVQKVTNLTNEAVDKLTNSLMDLNTRTDLSNLMQLAEQGGKLGIALGGGEQALVSFVKAGEQIVNTLGEIGGAEAVTELLKVNDLVNKSSEALLKNGEAVRDMGINESLMRTGSAILNIGNNSKASYAKVSDFTRQMGAIGSAAKLSMPDIMALGGTIDALGGDISASATAVQKIVMGLRSNTQDVARAAGIGATQLREALDMGDTMGAFSKVLEGIKRNGSDISDVLKAMGGRQNVQAKTTLTLLVNNLDSLNYQLMLAKEGFEDGKLVSDEFEKANNNLAGTVEQIKNEFREMTSSAEGSHGAMLTLSQAVLSLVRAFNNIGGIGLAITAMLSHYIAATVASTVATYKHATAHKVLHKGETNILKIGAVFISYLWNKVGALLHVENAAIRATNAMNNLKRASAASWIGVVVSVVMTLVYALSHYESAAKKAAKRMQELTEAGEQEIATLTRLYGKLQNTNLAQERRTDLINQFNKQFGSYIGHLITETTQADLLASAYHKAAAAIKEKNAATIEEEASKQAYENHKDDYNKYSQSMMDHLLGSKYDKRETVTDVIAYVRYYMEQNANATVEDVMANVSKEFSNDARLNGVREVKVKAGKGYNTTFEYRNKLSDNYWKERNAFKEYLEDYIKELMEENEEYKDASVTADSLRKAAAKDKTASLQKLGTGIFATHTNDKGETVDDLTDEEKLLRLYDYMRDMKALAGVYTEEDEQADSTHKRGAINAEKASVYDSNFAELQKKIDPLVRSTSVWGKSAGNWDSMGGEELKEVIDWYEYIVKWITGRKKSDLVDVNAANDSTVTATRVREAFLDDPEHGKFLAEGIENWSVETIKQWAYQQATKARAIQEKNNNMNRNATFKWDSNKGSKHDPLEELMDKYLKRLEDFYNRQKDIIREQYEGQIEMEDVMNRELQLMDEKYYAARVGLEADFAGNQSTLSEARLNQFAEMTQREIDLVNERKQTLLAAIRGEQAAELKASDFSGLTRGTLERTTKEKVVLAGTIKTNETSALRNQLAEMFNEDPTRVWDIATLKKEMIKVDEDGENKYKELAEFVQKLDKKNQQKLVDQLNKQRETLTVSGNKYAKGSKDRRDFIEMMRPVLEAEMQKQGIDASYLDTLLGQMFLESRGANGGLSGLAKRYNNFSGMTRGTTKLSGEKTVRMTNSKGQDPNTYVVFDSVEQYVEQYLMYLSRKFDAFSGDKSGFAERLRYGKQGGYATDKNYGSKINNSRDQIADILASATGEGSTVKTLSDIEGDNNMNQSIKDILTVYDEKVEGEIEMVNERATELLQNAFIEMLQHNPVEKWDVAALKSAAEKQGGVVAEHVSSLKDFQLKELVGRLTYLQNMSIDEAREELDKLNQRENTMFSIEDYGFGPEFDRDLQIIRGQLALGDPKHEKKLADLLANTSKDLLTYRKELAEHFKEIHKILLDGKPLEKAADEFRSAMTKLGLIFTDEELLMGKNTEREMARRLSVFRGYSAQILTMSEDEFTAQISQVEGFVGRTEEEYKVMYQQLLQFRDDYDEAARKQAKQSLKLLTNRVESGEYYAQQLASLRKYQEELVKAGKTGTEAYLSVARAIEVVSKKQNQMVDGKQTTYQQRMKQMLESANRRVKMEEGVKNSGVNNGVQLGQAKLRVATTDFAMAMEEYQIRREEANRIILDVLKQIEDAKAAMDALEEGTEEHEKAKVRFEALGLELKKAKVQEAEILADTYDKMLEKQRAVAEQEAEIQAERINSVQEFAESFRDVIERVSMADITARDAKAFELSKLRYEKELGLVQDFTRQRYLIIRKDGDNYEKWMTQEEAILFQQQIDAQNQRREALAEGLKNFGEKIGKQLRDAMNRQMELRDEERKERDRQKVIQNVQAEALAFQRNAEHNQTLFLKSELDSRLEYWENYFRKINSMGAEGTVITTTIGGGEPKKFATGGIADGPTSGDKTVIRVNGREMILTLEQQKRLLDIANGKVSQIGAEAVKLQGELKVDAAEFYDVLDVFREEFSDMITTDLKELVVTASAKPQPKNVATMQAEAVAMVDEKSWGRLWQSALSNVNIDSVIFDAISSSTKKGAFGPLTDKEAWKSIGISLGMNMATAASGVLTEKLGEWLNKKVIPNWGEHALGAERKATGKVMDEQLKQKAKEATVARKRTEKEFGEGSEEAKQAELAEAYAETYRELHRKAMDKLIKEANDAQDAMKKAVGTDEYSARRTEYMQKANAQVDEQQITDQTMSALNDKYGDRSGYSNYLALSNAQNAAQQMVSGQGWKAMLGEENSTGNLVDMTMGQDMTLGSQLTGDAEMQKIAAYVEAWKAAYAEIGEAADQRVSDALASDQTLTAEAKQAVQTQTKDAKAAFGQQQKAGEAKEKGLQVASMATAAVSSGVQDMITQASGNSMLGQMAGTIAQVGGNVIAGIASGSAKTVGEMGWWGTVYIPLIQGALMALLGLATSKMKKAQTEVAQATNVSSGKLTTGMLTYATGRYLDDEDFKLKQGMLTMADGYQPGQSYSVDGADGHSYSAKYEGAIKGTGIRKGTHFGIFSEVKPEMVIDGDTTALMHNKYPMLENAILQLHRTGSLNMGEMLGLNYDSINRTIETLSRSGALSFPGGRGGFRMPTFAEGRYPGGSIEGLGGIESLGNLEPTASQQADIDSRNRLAAAIEAMVTQGVQAHMSSRDASKQLAKQQRFEKRNGIKNGLYGAR